MTYNEIFINSEYAVLIQSAMKVSSAKPFVVMDLGANVGYFAFRVFDPIIQRHLDDILPDITMGQGKSRNSWKTGGNGFGRSASPQRVLAWLTDLPDGARAARLFASQPCM